MIKLGQMRKLRNLSKFSDNHQSQFKEVVKLVEIILFVLLINIINQVPALQKEQLPEICIPIHLFQKNKKLNKLDKFNNKLEKRYHPEILIKVGTILNLLRQRVQYSNHK